MKNALVLLAAVTVFTTLFLECSSSEAKENCVIDARLRQLVYEKSGMSDKVLEEIINRVLHYLVNIADGAYEKHADDLGEVYMYLLELQPQVTGLHTELKAMVDSGSCDGRDELVEKVKVAIKGIKKALASFENLTLPVDVREGLKEKMEETLVTNAEEVAEEMLKA